MTRGGGLQHHRTRSIAKQDTGGPILPVQHTTELFRADDQGIFHGTRRHKLPGRFQAVEKSGTGGFQVKTKGLACTDVLLDKTGRIGKHHVGRHGGNHDHFHILSRQTRHGQCMPGGFGSQVGGGLVIAGNPPFGNTGPRPDPFVGSIHDLGQVGIGQNPFRQIRAHTGNHDPPLAFPVPIHSVAPIPAISRTIDSLICSFTNSHATRTA